ncbi:MAG TPA: hypothetical protein PLW48_02170 [Alphaproteobacteria bacterium]|nr:hypothetical protein [Rhodospirillaceae bacterium]HRJ65915.1 hypothetical protein [Alphaproteobacteria bacterium]
MAFRKVVDIMRWCLFAFAACFIIYTFGMSGANFSSDDENMKAFKRPLGALSDARPRFATALELFGGSVFEGEKICISIRNEYAEGGEQGQRNELARLFPDRVAAVRKLNLSDGFPKVIVAVAQPGGRLFVATGDAKIAHAPSVDIGLELVAVDEEGKFLRATKHRGYRCVPFEDAVFVFSYHQINKRAYVMLADKRSPSLWPYGGVMAQDIASGKVTR